MRLLSFVLLFAVVTSACAFANAAEPASAQPVAVPKPVMSRSRQLEMRLMQEAADEHQRVQIVRRQEKAKQTAVETEIRRLGAGNSLPRIPAPPSRLPASVAEQLSIPVQRREPSLPIDSSSIYNASEPVAPRSAPVSR